jgi:DNA-binding beta-propeller fold protein YncE
VVSTVVFITGIVLLASARPARTLEERFVDQLDAGDDLASSTCLMPGSTDDVAYQTAPAAGQPAAKQPAAPQLPNLAAPASSDTIGGDIAPVRMVVDPYPSFNGIAVDTTNDLVMMSDTNRKSLLVYKRTDGSPTSTQPVQPQQQVMGPQTGVGFVAGVAMDPVHRELFTVNNDVEDRLLVFDYDARGNSKPKRLLYVPHQSWGIAFNKKRDELALSVQTPNMFVVFRREAQKLDAPVRSVRGAHTGMADPHGIYFDETHNEVVVGNHGNFRPATLITSYTAYDARESRQERGGAAFNETDRGRFLGSSITIYDGDANGDVAPLRTIAGPLTQVDWPMGVVVDEGNNEIFVANNGDNSLLVFDRMANGNVQPKRVIRGARTGIHGPMGVTLANDEIWIANFGDHTALVFPRAAAGNVAPRRVLRNAPAGKETSGFGNPYAVAYDTKREQVLVPNCVSQPRIAAFARLANGNVSPARVIQGQPTHLSRTTHGIAYDSKNDEIFAPNPLAAAMVIFRGGAVGEEAPIRTIQGAQTGLSRPETVAVDEVNNELFVGDPGDRRVLVYARNADGDVKPLRTIQGPKTKLLQVVGIAVDPVRNLLVVSTYSRLAGGVTGLLIFDRTAQGDVPPLRTIAGPKTGVTRLRQIALDPATGRIFAAVINNEYLPPYDVDKPRAGLDPNIDLPSPWNTGTEGFVGVWHDEGDDGDVPPHSVIKGRSTGIIHPAGVTFNARDGEVIAPDAVWNGLFTFLKPELFTAQAQRTNQ